MANVIVRPYEPSDEDEYFRVLSLVYGDGTVIPPEDRRPGHADRFVAEVDGEVHGIYSVLPMTCTRGLALLESGGIAAVGVLPEARRGGVASAMMRSAVREMRENGVPMASLYPYRETFYRRFGYETCGKRLRLSVPTERMPKLEEALPIRRLGPADWEALQPAQLAFAHARAGVSTRGERLWERVLGENRPLTVYAAGDPVEAYAVVAHKMNFWEDQWISEIAWSSRAGYESVLAFLKRLGANKTSLSWYEPSDSPFLAGLLDQGVSISVERLPMYRVNDVPAALRSLQAEASGEFSIAVRDVDIPENAGPWRVRYTPAGVEVEKGGEADLIFSIQEFTQAFLGDPSLESLLRMGRGTVQRPASILDASRLLTPMPVYLPDFF